MFDRVELKNNAKQFLQKNYWWVVLVTIIFSIASGTFSVGNNPVTTNRNMNTITNYNNIYINDFDYNDIITENSNEIFRNFGSVYSQWYRYIVNTIRNIPTSALIGISYIVLIIALISIVLSVFLLVPLRVGCRRWYLLNRTTKPEIGEVAHIFRDGYINTVKTIFLQNLFVSLWSLLFVIPGIIKSYEYRMIPYLLAENPNMDWQEAFDRSREMMKGNKWAAFVLDWSFFGWKLLAACTCGVLSIFFVAPYIQLTNAELYVKLCQNGTGKSYEDYSYNNNPY